MCQKQETIYQSFASQSYATPSTLATCHLTLRCQLAIIHQDNNGTETITHHLFFCPKKERGKNRRAVELVKARQTAHVDRCAEGRNPEKKGREKLPYFFREYSRNNTHTSWLATRDNNKTT